MTHRITVVNTSSKTNESVEILHPEEVTLKNGGKHDFEIPTVGALGIRLALGPPRDDRPDPHNLYDTSGKPITQSVEVRSVYRYSDGSICPNSRVPENYRK